MVQTPPDPSPADPSAGAEVTLARAVRRIGRPGFAQALRDWLRTVIAFDNLLVTLYRASAPPKALFRQADLPRVYAELDTVYMSGSYTLDPFYALFVARSAVGAYRLRDIAPDAFTRSRSYDAYYRQTTLVDEIAFLAYPAADLSIHVCIGRDAASARPFRSRDVTAARRIAPVVAALADRAWVDLTPEPGRTGDEVATLAADLRDRHGIHLSPRQIGTALLILRGHSSPSIALHLGVAVGTVKVFRRQLYRRCGITSQAELFSIILPLLQ